MTGRVFLIAFIILWWAPASAEVVDTAWVRFYNGGLEDYPVSVGSDLWGNVYVTGYSYGEGTERDYATVKYNPRGEIVWIRRFNGSANLDDRPWAKVTDPEGNVYLTGQSTEIGTDWDCTTIKYKSNGDTAWVRKYNGDAYEKDYGYSIFVDDSGYVYVAGVARITSGDSDYLTVKYGPDGDIEWIRTYAGPETDQNWARAITVDNGGNVYVTGTSLTHGVYHYLTVKYHPDGEIAWAKTSDGIGGMAIACDDSGNVYVSGLIEEFLQTIKYDQYGNKTWIKKYTEIGTNTLYGRIGLAVDGCGNVYLCWNGQPEVTGCYYLVIKYRPNGNIDWIKEHHGTTSSSYASDVTLDIKGDVYVTGVCNSYYLTLKYNPQGDLIWSQEYTSAGIWWQNDPSITIEPLGNVYVAGLGNKNYGDFVVVKYVQFWYSRGDMNQDENINIVDVVYLLNYLFKSGPAPVPYLSLGDADGDADIDISDILYLIDYIFKRGPKPCL